MENSGEDRVLVGRIALLFMFAAATCGVYARETAYPLYTVTVAEGVTNNLDEAMVSVVAAEGGTASEVTFSSLSGSITSGTFRKRGRGFLKSSTGMGSFSGEARIEEGVLIIDGVGQLGPMAEGSTTDPLVVVSNGASIIVAYDGLPADESKKNKVRFCGGLQIAGNGYNGIGAIRSESTQRNNYLFSSDIMLNGDALMVNATRATAADDKVWGVQELKYFNLNGHTLTMAGGPFRDYKMTFTNPGHVVVDGNGDFRFHSHLLAWQGNADNTFTVKSGSLLRFDTADTNLKSPWTLVLEDGARLYSTISTPGTNRCCWAGPIRLEGSVDAGNNGKSYSLSLLGPISGTGELVLSRGRLHLASDGSTFAGGVRASTTDANAEIPILCLWSSKALPSPFVSTNANLNLCAPSVYELPALSFYAEAGRTLSVSGGVGGVAASLVKTGPGPLDLVAPIAVTGGVTLAGGTLRLSSEISPYSPAPGLIESFYVAANQTEHDAMRPAWYRDGTVMNTNRVVSFPELAEKRRDMDPGSWTDFQFVRYKGYIWNRSNEDVTWTFAVSICPQNRLYIDDQLVVSHDTAQGDNWWKKLKPTTLTLSPGHHSFDLRLDNPTGYTAAGARGSQSTDGLNWPETGLGFAIDFQGRGSYDASCYVVPSNNVLGSVCGGDGSLFTVDARERADGGTDFSRASFPRLTATPGTVLDLNAPGRTFEIKELVGATTVSNGNLRVSESWTLANSDIASGKPLEAEAGITFADGWTLRIPDLATLTGGSRTLAISRSGGLTLPSAFTCDAGTPGRWHLELADGGTRLELVSGGFYMIIR